MVVERVEPEGAPAVVVVRVVLAALVGVVRVVPAALVGVVRVVPEALAGVAKADLGAPVQGKAALMALAKADKVKMVLEVKTTKNFQKISKSRSSTRKKRRSFKMVLPLSPVYQKA